MSIQKRIAAGAAFAALAFTSFAALADDHSYTEGAVVTVGYIRTVDGHFDDYMNWLDTTWKALQEAGKKKGYIVSYQVVSANPHGPDDPDLLLIVTYKNFAALDGGLAKGDEIAKLVEGSVAAANASQQDRAKIRRVLGGDTYQVLELK
ncbi:MAG TPA: hypothetical protein VE046_06540 [Steroidobacteraceae bacterium]|nr:hypothetical protein [Steroidobacteraceae bacterium]